MMKDSLPTTVNGGMVGDRASITEQHDIAWLRHTFDLPKPGGHHIF
ncbi:hypothetical protein ETAE_2474 [Edwardsiella piscicida]|uniref:Uncharacterized protein n=1 Tax=Edwardsiella piscicida TaxID=1263550 RepID=A0AAU8P4V3_EDWPI|nr:hypothetical protein ETAE_2474 [Edwardsiella tarda EIB202]